MDAHRKQPVSPEVAMASEVFDQFCSATTLKTILGHHRHLCELLHLKPNVFPLFYPKLKAKLRSWKAQALWNKFDKRASHKCYNRGKACPDTRVLIIGAGPCGLRSAIEAQLLGCKVVVVEKRDRITRNNVLHLWPFVIQDLRALGAKKFFGKFCAGAIDHISIRQLQCILLKVALILGVEFHEGVGFEALVPPPENQSVERIGWRCVTSPSDHPVSQYEFDVLIGADGKRNTLEGFRRKEFRGKLAIAITANFINRRSEAEARVEEISGVAFIFNQKFFKDLYAATGIDLENIVYYKDETHYFVMTAKKLSLLNKNVIIKDLPDTAKLLDRENVNKDALEQYAREAANFSTNYKLPHTEFAVNHYGQPDVAMFDFTSMYAAENASRVVERHGHKLLTLLVGDSLLEPFWPTGSGCARGLLSVLDACWAVRAWGGGANPLEVLAERESVYRLLGQTTPENLNRDLNAYTLEPHTRYPNLNARCVAPIQVRGLFDTDKPEGLETLLAMPSASALDPPKKRRRKDSQVHSDTLLMWLKKQVALYDNVRVDDMTTSFKNGLVLCAIIHRYRPDLIDFHTLQPENIVANNQLAFDILERELGVSPVMTAQEMEQCEVPDKLAMLSYLSQIYDTFRGEIPHIKHPKLDEAELAKEKKAEQIIATRMRELDKLTTGQKVNLLGRLTALPLRTSTGRKREAESDRHETPGGSSHSERAARRSVESSRKSRKRRSNLPERVGHTLEERMSRLERLEDIKRNREERERRGRYLRKLTTQQFHKSMQMLQANALLGPDAPEGPFEDYSIFLYRMTAPDFQDRVKHLEQKLLYPSRDSKILEEMKRGSMDPDFSGRVKNIEEKLKGIPVTEKKPRDLLRAIGKIESTDWNVKEIEKKIEENKGTSRLSKQRAEKVPKWSREKFQDKMQAVERRLKVKGTEEELPNKYQEYDVSMKNSEKKLKEGSALEAGKVSAMAAQLASMNQEPDKPSVQRSNSRAAIVLPSQGASEVCHFCNKRVYLMERSTAEGRFFHRGCFRCEYCKTTLRVGNYAFDRDGKFGSRFFCTHHFGLHGTGKMKTPCKLAEMVGKEKTSRRISRPSDKPKRDTDVDGADVRAPKTPVQATAAQELDKDRGHTPERITFDPVGSSDPDDNPSEMDEDEWTDRNFGASAAECGSSDDLSDLSDESDGEEAEAFAEAIDTPMTADETLRLAERWSRRYSSVGGHQNGSNPDDENQPKRAATADDEDDLESGSYDYDDSEEDFSYHEYDSEDDDSDTATEGEEDIRARELRKQEVRLVLPERPPGRRGSDTGSDTEVASDDYSSSESKSEVENSATEIETDSEFEHDGTTPTRHEIPDIIIDDSRLHTKESKEPKKVQVRAGNVLNGNVGQVEPPGIKLQFAPLESKAESNNNPQSVIRPSPLVNPRAGDYALNRVHSTGGIASKISNARTLELKKRYLFGEDSGTAVRKSGSATALDTQFKSLVDQISEHQKLLNPAPEPSPSMQAYLQGTSKLHTSPLASTESKPTSTTPTAAPLALGKKELPLLSDSFKHICGQKEAVQEERDSPQKEKTLSIQGHKELPAAEGFQHVCGKNDATPVDVDDRDDPLDSLQPDSLIVDQKETNESQSQADCRPRSPVHETSIIVPSIAWDNVKAEKGDDMDSDSLSSDVSLGVEDEIEEEEEGFEEERPKAPSPTLPPRVEIHNSSGELMSGDRQPGAIQVDSKAGVTPPKTLQLNSSESPAATRRNQMRVAENQSGRSSPSTPTSLCGEGGQAALTETELSDWAGDAGVSEDLDDVEFVINPEYVTLRKHQRPKKGGRGAVRSLPVRMATGEDFGDFEDRGHVCGKSDDFAALPVEKLEDHPISRLQALETEDNIEFMDTGEENNVVDDANSGDRVPIANRGYVHFVDLEEKDVVSAANHALLQMRSGEGYMPLKDNEEEEEEEDAATPVAEVSVVIGSRALSSTETSNSNSNSSSSTSSATPSSVQNQQGTSSTAELITDEVHHDEESHHMEAVTTTEDTTTTSDVTTVVDTHAKQPEEESAAYKECMKRLQGRVSPFVNVRDSIDVRKSRKSSRSSLESDRLPGSPTEMKTPETQPETPVAPIANATANSSKSPTTCRKLQQISQERSKQKSLIHELVLDKVLSQKKLHERKPRKAIRSTPSPLAGSLSHGCIPLMQKDSADSKPPDERPALPPGSVRTCDPEASPPYSTPMAWKTPAAPSQKEEVTSTAKTAKKRAASETRPRPISVHGLRSLAKASENINPIQTTPLSHFDGLSMPDLRKALLQGDGYAASPGGTPLRPKNEDRERARLDARVRAQSKTDEELGLSPEDYIRALKEKAARKPEFSDMTDSATRARLLSAGGAASTSSPLPGVVGDYSHVYQDASARGKRKPKDTERRRSIIQAVSDFFHKKSTPSPVRVAPAPPLFARDREHSTDRELLKFPRFRFAPKVKDKEKVHQAKQAAPTEGASSFANSSGSIFPRITPPTGDYLSNGPNVLRGPAEDSFSEADDGEDSTTAGMSTQSAAVDSSTQSKKQSRQSRRVARQAQLKRLRMAQEIQRQLEEVEVKQRELERLGVSLEKALRGEGTAEGGQEEVELLQEWFVLNRERSQLSRYEKELSVRAKELEFEDTHARLQLELRDHMAKDESSKTEEDVAKEGQILKEMLEIGAQRDSLIALLEADRQRYQEEDKDLEAQMLAQGFRLTPLRKESHV